MQELMEVLAWFGFNDKGHLGCNSVDAHQNELVGTAISGYNGVLFSLYPGLDSGYLFQEKQITLLRK